MKIYYKNLSAFTYLALAISGILSTSTSYAQKGVAKPYTTKWSVNPYDHQVFIENKGQFDQLINEKASIVFAAQLGDNLFAYFTTNGIIYRQCIYPKFADAKKEMAERKDYDPDKEDIKPEVSFISAHWEGSNPGVTLDAADAQPDYYTYPTGKNSSVKVTIYKKITYKNLYPGIDAEYSFIKGKQGFKYALIVHPGADLSSVKLAYSGASSAKIDEGGDITIKTTMGDFIDHAPVSMYSEGDGIGSSYTLKGLEESFAIDNTYDKSKTLVIDPWSSSPGFVTNKAYDLDFDNAGNVYVYGSSSNWQLAKFDNTGLKQWTYNATTLSTGYYGDFACDKLSGKCILTEGFNSSGMDVVEVSTAGIQLSTNKAIANLQEGWRDVWDPCNSQVIIGGGGWQTICDAGGMVDTNLVITPVNVLGETVSEEGHDMALTCVDPSGNTCYMATTRSAGDGANFDNEMMQFPVPALFPAAYMTPTGYTFAESNVAQYVGVSVANGLNGMTATPNWLYIYDGSNLKRVNKTTGAIVTTLNVSPTIEEWSGLDADFCDNIYMGIKDSVYVYNSSLSIITKMLLPNTVYDVQLGQNGVMYACGNGFVNEMNIPVTPTLISTAFTSPASCSACNGKASVTVNCGIPPYTFNWSNGTTGSKDSLLCAGNYTVTVTDGSCPPRHDSAVVTVLGKLGYTAAVVDTNPNCAKSKGNITVFPTGGTPTYTYAWNTGATTQSDTGLVAGTYNCTITDSAGCKYTISVTLTNPTTPSISIAPIKDSVCLGFSASLTAKGGKTYTWMPGSLSGSTVTVSPATTTTYTVLALDSNGCSGSATATVIVNPPPSITVTPPSDSICKGSSVTLKASGGNSYTWKPNTGLTCYNCASPTATPLVNTTWTVTGTDSHGCIDSTTVTVIVKPIPVGTIITKPDTVCIGDSATLIAGGGGSYVWTFSGQTSDSVKVGPVTTTTYNLQVTKDGCTSVTSAKVVVVGSVIPTIAIAKDSICKGDSTTITAAGGSSYKWLPGGAITSVITVKPSLTTTYSCIITTACGIDTLSEKLTVLPFPIISLSPDTTICTGSSAVLKATGGGTYKWTPGGATTSTITVTPGSTQTYSVSVSNGTCAKDTSITVVVNNPPPIDLTPDQVVCQGATVYFADTAKGAFKYLWSNGATTSSITVVPSGNTTYTLVVSNGCLDSAVAHVKVNISGLSACCDTTIITGDTVTIRATGSGNYLWAPDPSSLSCYTCPDPVASPTVTTTYTVTGTDSNGCVADRLVTIFVECIDFTVPNVFTPNNDGINDDLVIKALNPSSYTINIYDRWGKEVYTSNDATKYWNGDLMNTQYLVPDGVYYYIIKATCGGNNYDKHGFVQVIGGK